MAYTPVEIRHVRLRQGLIGYRAKSVDRLLGDIADSFETVWRERADLADHVEQLEADLVRFRELEQLLRTTLVSAERAAADMRDQAKREAKHIVDEAHAEARAITREARAQREHLAAEARRIRVLLHAALDAIEEAGDDGDEERSEAEAA